MNQELQRTDGRGNALSVSDMVEQVNQIQRLMRHVMHEDVHYGMIPGTNKRALLKPGAEKIGLLFGCTTDFTVRRDELDNGHREYEVICRITDRNGNPIGQGLGSCTTMEKKYRYRAESTGKMVPREYWDEGKDPDILGGPSFVPRKVKGAWMIFRQTEYDNPADYYNTCLKMAKKRAYVDAILTCTAASDFFDQEEILDTPELYPHGAHGGEEPPEKKKEPYSDERFDANLDAWRGLVESGKKTADQIIANLELVAIVSDKQKERIRALEAAPDEESETEQETSE